MNELRRAASALQHLDATCSREDWVKTGMASKSAGLSFNNFHAWSATGDNYKSETDCMAVWRSFKTGQGVSAASLFQMAIVQGWKNSTNGLIREKNMLQKIPSSPTLSAENLKASSIWELCEPATVENAYIQKKGGISDNLRIYPDTAPTLRIEGENVAGWLVVPCMSAGKLQTLQFIPGEGNKLNLPGGKFNDGFFTVGDLATANRIDIVEGIGQAWACTAVTWQAAVVCFGAGRMETVARALRNEFPAKRLILIPDCGKEIQAKTIAGRINCEWCELPGDKPKNYDVHDYLLEFTAAELLNVLNAIHTPMQRFQLFSAQEISNTPPMQWLVRGVLPSDGLAALYGASGSGKSFLALDLAAHIAEGRDTWFGYKVNQCPVTYCALEGEAGLGKRIAAWCSYNEKSVPPSLRFIKQPIDILNPIDLAELAQSIQFDGGSNGLVILDTLNRAAPAADENSSVDMGKIIAAAKRFQEKLGGVVLFIHHTGKDKSRGLRGHSSLYAALDGVIEVCRTENQRDWNVAKAKEDETGAVHGFALDIVPVGLDEDGEEITSCVVVVDDVIDTIKRVKLPVGGNQKIALDTLSEPLRQSSVLNKDGAPIGRPCIELSEAVRYISERLTCDTKRRNERAQSTLTAMIAKGIYGLKDNWLWRI